MEHRTFNEYHLKASKQTSHQANRQKEAWKDRKANEREFALKTLRTTKRIDYFFSLVEGTNANELEVLFHYNDDIEFE